VTTNLGLPTPTDVLLIEAGDSTVVVQCLGGGFTLSAVFGSEPDLIAAKGVLRDHVRAIREIIESAAKVDGTRRAGGKRNLPRGRLSWG